MASCPWALQVTFALQSLTLGQICPTAEAFLGSPRLPPRSPFQSLTPCLCLWLLWGGGCGPPVRSTEGNTFANCSGGGGRQDPVRGGKGGGLRRCSRHPEEDMGPEGASPKQTAECELKSQQRRSPFLPIFTHLLPQSGSEHAGGPISQSDSGEVSQRLLLLPLGLLGALPGGGARWEHVPPEEGPCGLGWWQVQDIAWSSLPMCRFTLRYLLFPFTSDQRWAPTEVYFNSFPTARCTGVADTVQLVS